MLFCDRVRVHRRRNNHVKNAVILKDYNKLHPAKAPPPNDKTKSAMLVPQTRL